MTFQLQQILGDKVAIADDRNLPHRATALGDLDIDTLWNIPALKEVGPADVVLDLGAFVGDTAISFLKKGASVIAFEPFFDAYCCMVVNTYAFKNLITPYNAPAGDGREVSLIYECLGSNKGMRWVSTSPTGLGHRQTVRTIPIDELKLPKLTVAKIDVEGFESIVLKGMAQTIKRCRPRMFVEVYPDALSRQGSSVEQLTEELRSFDYRLEMCGEPPRFDWICWPQ